MLWRGETQSWVPQPDSGREDDGSHGAFWRRRHVSQVRRSWLGWGVGWKKASQVRKQSNPSPALPSLSHSCPKPTCCQSPSSNAVFGFKVPYFPPDVVAPCCVQPQTLVLWTRKTYCNKRQVSKKKTKIRWLTHIPGVRMGDAREKSVSRPGILEFRIKYHLNRERGGLATIWGE